MFGIRGQQHIHEKKTPKFLSFGSIPRGRGVWVAPEGSYIVQKQLPSFLSHLNFCSTALNLDFHALGAGSNRETK